MSPREALDRLRGKGISEELWSGRLLRFTNPPDLAANSALRLAQLKAVADDARRSPYPVIIAGDTNLPQLSWVLRHVLSDFRDGFDEVGSGFGYTYPISRRGPWMRIDRILAGPGLRFYAFEVVEPPVSDHLAVVADLELAR
jgi:endonuclease/exonuclease/phosphatase family metal-dependent hydrolase